MACAGPGKLLQWVVMDSKTTRRRTESAANWAHDHPVLKNLARAGYVVTGLLHILIGLIAVRIATGSGGGEASNSGALAQIACAPGGRIALWVAAVGLAALALWRFAEVLIGPEMKDRARGAILGVVYLFLSITAGRFAAGGSSSDGDKASGTTATVLQQSWGVPVVIAAGLVITGVGVYSLYKGATKKFLEEIESRAASGDVGSAIVCAGVVGYIARGVAFAVLGGLVVWAALSNDPEKAGGLDAALRYVGQQPAGMILLIIVGVGLALYGVYCIARAKYIDE